MKTTKTNVGRGLLGALFLTAGYAVTASAQQSQIDRENQALLCNSSLRLELISEYNRLIEYYGDPNREQDENSYQTIGQDKYAFALDDTLQALRDPSHEIASFTDEMNHVFVNLKGPRAIGLTGACETYANDKLVGLPVIGSRSTSFSLIRIPSKVLDLK